LQRPDLCHAEILAVPDPTTSWTSRSQTFPARVRADERAPAGHPTHAEREVVDLLFFPTGGGKTEAYLGLAAFTLALRRLRNPSLTSAGVTVLMRYTLRLLTLDQLERAATLICALELERRKDPGAARVAWPF
jgi:hypothetical protein